MMIKKLLFFLLFSLVYSSKNKNRLRKQRQRPSNRPTNSPLLSNIFECYNGCFSRYDGICDDGGLNSINGWCPYGSDCADCGSRENEIYP